MAPALARASDAHASVAVSARVLKIARLTQDAHPPVLVIRAVDIARGFVDVDDGSLIAIESNNPQGYAIEVASRGKFLRKAIVDGFASPIEAAPSGGLVVASVPAGRSTRTYLLHFRFVLERATVPGVYAWPLSVGVMPL